MIGFTSSGKLVAMVVVGGVAAGASGCLAPIEWGEPASIAKQAKHVERVRQAGHRQLKDAKHLSSHYRKRNRDALKAYASKRVRRGRNTGKDEAAKKVKRGQAGHDHFRRIYIHATPHEKRVVPREISGGEPVMAHFINAPLHSVIDALALVGGSNIIAAKRIADEKVTFRVRHARWRDVLAIVARTHDWVAHGDDQFIYVRPPPEGDHDAVVAEAVSQVQRVELLRLVYVSAEEMKKAAAALFVDTENKPLMSADQRTGSLVVKGSVEQINMVASLAKALDKPLPKILIETFIVEAGKGLERSLGARLGINRFDSAGVIRVGGVTDANGRSNTGEDQEEDSVAERWVVNLPIAVSAGGIVGLFDSDRLRVELTALEQEGKTRIVSNPRVFTLDGREAVVFQGDEVPYFSVSESGTQTEFKEAGVRLAVTPKVVGNGNMILEVTVNKDTVDTRVQNPPITRRQIDTTLLVADGELVVIGGIYFDTLVRAETRVPFFSRIPLLGRLFKRSQDTRDFRELLVFIAPRIVPFPS